MQQDKVVRWWRTDMSSWVCDSRDRQQRCSQGHVVVVVGHGEGWKGDCTVVWWWLIYGTTWVMLVCGSARKTGIELGCSHFVMVWWSHDCGSILLWVKRVVCVLCNVDYRVLCNGMSHLTRLFFIWLSISIWPTMGSVWVDRIVSGLSQVL